MPVLIKNAAIERKVKEYADRQPVPPTKTAVVERIIDAVFEAAEASGKDAGDIIRELREGSRQNG